MNKKIYIKREVLESILTYAQMLHPKEAILLLTGKINKQKLMLTDTQIPPLATHGNTFSVFPLNRLPIDFSVMGIAHSHPSGVLHPSIIDLNKFYGRIMIITAYPYLSEQNLAIFDREGKSLNFIIF
jgi:proteasome lid subunit RPN8/RPN11